MSLSILIPVHNEEDQLKITVPKLIKFKKKIKDLEIIFVDDFSTDNTKKTIYRYMKNRKYIRLVDNKKKGLGSAINSGIIASKKEYLCIFMADLSDDLNDVEKYFYEISKKNYDAILGSRFIRKSSVKNYPLLKLILNRLFNIFVKLIFFSDYNDFTNGFKIYKKKTLIKILPIISKHFNVFLELPLKIIIRKYNYKIIPISWKKRNKGVSKFKINELGPMYISTMLYFLREKILLNKKK